MLERFQNFVVFYSPLHFIKHNLVILLFIPIGRSLSHVMHIELYGKLISLLSRLKGERKRKLLNLMEHQIALPRNLSRMNVKRVL